MALEVGTLEELDGILSQYTANISVDEEASTDTREQKVVEVQGFAIPYWVDTEKQEYGFVNVERDNAVTKSYEAYEEFKDLFLAYIDIHALLLPTANAIAQSYVDQSGLTLGRYKIARVDGIYYILYNIKEKRDIVFAVKDIDEQGNYLAGEFEKADGGKPGKLTENRAVFTFNDDEELVEIDVPDYILAMTEDKAEEDEAPVLEEEPVVEEEVVEEEPVVEEEEVVEEETVEEVAEEEPVVEEEPVTEEEELVVPEEEAEPVYEPVVEETVQEEVTESGTSILVRVFYDVEETEYIRFIKSINGKVTSIRDVKSEDMIKYGFTKLRVATDLKEYRKCGVIIDEDVARNGVVNELVTDADEIYNLVMQIINL